MPEHITEVAPIDTSAMTTAQKKKRITELREELAALERTDADTFREEILTVKPSETAEFLDAVTSDAPDRTDYEPDGDYTGFHSPEHKRKVQAHLCEEAKKE